MAVHMRVHTSAYLLSQVRPVKGAKAGADMQALTQLISLSLAAVQTVD